MTRIFWTLLLSSPVLLGIASIGSASALAVGRSQSIAAEAPATTKVDQPKNVEIRLANSKANAPLTPSETPIVNVGNAPTPILISQQAEVIPIGQTRMSDQKTNRIAQVTSVSELSDVQPTDWAFQAVQSLVERYACIEGYPDRTFRGNRAATRYELAAALNACLNQISAQLGGLTAEDLATIKRLQDEFAAELATLRGRVDALEARTTELEANQFSTTTKLEGQAIIAPQYGEFGDAESRATAIARVRLGLSTSFTGDDLLFTELEVGNAGEDLIGNVTGDAPFAEFAERTGGIDYAGVDSTVDLFKLHYTFKPIPDLAITIGPAIEASDFVDTNSYANDEAADFSSNFFINNPLIITSAEAGAGAFLDWNFGGGPFTLRAVYVGASPTNALANQFGGGLFGDPYQATGELEFAPGDVFAVRLQYTTASISDVKYSVYGVNAEFTIAERFGIFGRYGNGILDGYGTRSDVDLSPETFMAGIGIRDLFTEDSLLALAVGQPFIEEGLGDATQTNYEAFYRFPVNDNITVTPTVSVITDANNNSDSATIYQGVLRTVFFF